MRKHFFQELDEIRNSQQKKKWKNKQNARICLLRIIFYYLFIQKNVFLSTFTSHSYHHYRTNNNLGKS